jgi:undecaprenyl-diphosphatase
MRRVVAPRSSLSASIRSTPKELKILAALLAVALWGWAFVLVLAIFGFARVQSFDERVLLWLRHSDNLAVPIGPKWLPGATQEITALGSGPVLLFVTLSVIGYLWLERRYGLLALVLASTFGGVLIATALKSLLGRPRPAVVPHLVPVSSMSFPSGHSMLSTTVYMTLGTLLTRATSDRLTKLYFVLLASTLTILIGLSRIYLGVHYPTDVLGGWAAGLLWALACGLVARELERRRVIRPGDAPAGQRVARSTRST